MKTNGVDGPGRFRRKLVVGSNVPTGPVYVVKEPEPNVSSDGVTRVVWRLVEVWGRSVNF